METQIKIFPVDNGDQSLISVTEDKYRTDIMVDTNIRVASEGDTDASKYDVKADLLNFLKQKTVNDVSNVPYVDIFILTHGDEDHLLGFERNFYQGDPKQYKKKNKDEEQVLIDVLWFSPMVMGTATNDDEKCFNKEAKRRIKLHRDKSPDKDLAGNRIVIIGKDANEDLSGLDLVRKVPGDIVTRFNNRDLKTFSIFIHSPYQEQLTDEEVDKNRVSVVFQARFKEKESSTDFCTLAMFGGDADHLAWAIIQEKTKKHKNDVNQKALLWDLFVAPHHCSWTFFNNTPQSENPDPVQTALDMLDNARKGAIVIASSKAIKNNDDNPPSYKAKQQYIKKLDSSDRFLNTATDPNEKSPEPILFEITANGPVRPPKNKTNKTQSAGAIAAGAIGGAIKHG